MQLPTKQTRARISIVGMRTRKDGSDIITLPQFLPLTHYQNFLAPTLNASHLCGKTVQFSA